MYVGAKDNREGRCPSVLTCRETEPALGPDSVEVRKVLCVSLRRDERRRDRRVDG